MLLGAHLLREVSLATPFPAASPFPMDLRKGLAFTGLDNLSICRLASHQLVGRGKLHSSLA